MVELFIAALNAHDVEAVVALCAESCVMLASTNVRREGRDALRQYWQGAFEMYPDARVTARRLIPAGSTVVAEWEIAGTNTGPITRASGEPLAPPSGKSVTFDGVLIFDVEGERIAALRLVFDQLAQMRQLGLVPPLEELAARAR